MTSLENDTTVIIIRDSDPLFVKTRTLTESSPVFFYLFEQCEFEDHDLSDFEPDAVRLFLTLLDDKKMEDLESKRFRDINKMSVVFKVKWLEEDCYNWMTKKIMEATDKDEITFLFEECYFVMERLEKTNYMDMFVGQFGRTDRDISWLISNYLANLGSLEINMLRPLLQLAGSNNEILLDSLFENVINNSHLSKNALYLLQNINMQMCAQANGEGWSNLFEQIGELPEISNSDLKLVLKLAAEAWRTVSSSHLKRKQTTVLSNESNINVYKNCRTLADTVAAVTDGKIDSMFTVVDLLTTLSDEPSFSPIYIPSIIWLIWKLIMFILWGYSFKEIGAEENMDQFIPIIEKLCVEKEMKRIPWQIIDPIISLLKYSPRDNAKNLIALLTSIRRNAVLSSPNRENIIIPRDREVEMNSKYSNDYKYFYKFKHPGAGKCNKAGECGFIILRRCHSKEKLELVTDNEYYEGTGIHYHDIISARDMHMYCVYTVILRDGTKLETVESCVSRIWWEFWFSRYTRTIFKGHYVAYNVSDYMVAK